MLYAIYIYIQRHDVIDPAAMFVYTTWPLTSEGPKKHALFLPLSLSLRINISVLAADHTSLNFRG